MTRPGLTGDLRTVLGRCHESLTSALARVYQRQAEKHMAMDMETP